MAEGVEDDGVSDGTLGQAGRSATSRRCLTVAYDGADFSGWQVQPDRRTVQGVLEEALSEVLDRSVRIVGSGRTDAGVHALGQVAHFDDEGGMDQRRLGGALSGLLPLSVRPVSLVPAAVDFHARHSAIRKSYVYQLHLSPLRGGERLIQRSVPPHRRGTHLAVPDDLDLGAMRLAARALTGTHDFTLLSKVMPAERGTVRTVTAVRLLRFGRSVRLVVSGEGFLYGMVRLMAGLLVEVGRGRVLPGEVPGLLMAADRTQAPASLPAHALFLWRVDYKCDPRGRARRHGLLS